jgi:hypothetical protein
VKLQNDFSGRENGFSENARCNAYKIVWKGKEACQENMEYGT